MSTHCRRNCADLSGQTIQYRIRWVVLPEGGCYWQLATDNWQLLFSRNPSSSNRTRTAGTSVCGGSPAVSPSSSDNIAPDRPLSLPPHVRAQSASAPLAVPSCPDDRIVRSCPLQVQSSIPCPPALVPRPHAARSLAATAIPLQESAITSHAPSRFHTFTYFPRSGMSVPSACRTATVNRPNSMAMSPE
jgi:hypothetical protein